MRGTVSFLPSSSPPTGTKISLRTAVSKAKRVLHSENSAVSFAHIARYRKYRVTSPRIRYVLRRERNFEIFYRGIIAHDRVVPLHKRMIDE